jgi:hypothetical protein
MYDLIKNKEVIDSNVFNNTKAKIIKMNQGAKFLSIPNGFVELSSIFEKSSDIAKKYPIMATKAINNTGPTIFSMDVK